MLIKKGGYSCNRNDSFHTISAVRVSACTYYINKVRKTTKSRNASLNSQAVQVTASSCLLM